MFKNIILFIGLCLLMVSSANAQSPPLFGPQLIYGGPVTVTQLQPPTSVTVSISGSYGGTSYCYIVTSKASNGESLGSTEICNANGYSSLSNSNTVNVNWTSVLGADHYNVYGRSRNAEQYLTTCPGGIGCGNLSFTDTGSLTPSGSLPTVNTTGTFVGVNKAYLWVSISSAPSSSQIFPGVCAVPYLFPINLAGTVVSCGTNPSESDAYILKIAGSPVATLTVSSTCTLSLSSQLAFTCGSGQRFELDAPGTVSGSNIAFAIPVSR